MLSCPPPFKKAGSVLEAMHLPPAVIDGSIRVSFSRDNTEADVDALCQALLHAKQTLKG